MSNKIKKDAFLILRVPVEFKSMIVAQAREAGKTVSQYMREQISAFIHG